MSEKKKGSASRDSYFHNTEVLLKKYRDLVWNLEVSSNDLQSEFRAEYGISLETCLSGMAALGADLEGTRIESHARTLERSRKMLSILNNAIELLRTRHKKENCTTGFCTTPIFRLRNTTT